MKWFIFFLLLAMSIDNYARAEPTWTAFTQIPYFTAKNRSCENQIQKALLPIFRSKGLSDAELQIIVPDMDRHLRSSDVLHPMVTGDDILIGTNLRWRGLTSECRNHLLHCKGNRTDSCEEIATFPNDQGLTPIFFNGNTIIANHTTYRADALNIGSEDYLVSSDLGKNWKKIETPVPCSGPGSGYSCTLLPRTAHTYTLLSSKLNQQGSDFQNLTIHSTDNGGKSWRVLTPPWSEIKHHFYVSAQEGSLLALPEADADYFSISVRNVDTGSIDSIRTRIPAAEWTSGYSRVLAYQNKYLVQAEGKWTESMPKDVGIFFVDKLLPDSSAKPVWTSLGMSVKDVKISDGLVVVRTWNPQSLSRDKINFNESIHYTTDEGIHWHVFDVPDDLLGSTMELSRNRIWMFSPFSIQYSDLPTPKSE